MTNPDAKYTCPNCEYEYLESFQYCPQCGQHHEESLLSFKEMFFDLMGAFFSFDTKAVRSFPRLFLRPGSLTKEYVRGKRETYLAPFRLYLFVSIILFLVLPLVVSDKAFIPKNNLMFEEHVGDSTVTHEVPVNDLFSGFADAITEDLDETLDSLQSADPEIDSAVEAIKNKTNFNVSTNQDGNFNMNFGDSSSLNDWNEAVQYVEAGGEAATAVDSFFTTDNRNLRFLLKQGLKLQSRGGEGLVSSLLDVSSYALFLFLPLFALLLKLMYVRRKRFYIEHLIFSLHFFSYFFMLIILYVLLIKFVFQFAIWIIFLIAGVYLYLAMKNYYCQGWFKTFFKWFMLLFTTSVFYLPVFISIALVISFIFY